MTCGGTGTLKSPCFGGRWLDPLGINYHVMWYFLIQKVCFSAYFCWYQRCLSESWQKYWNHYLMVMLCTWYIPRVKVCLLKRTAKDSFNGDISSFRIVLQRIPRKYEFLKDFVHAGRSCVLILIVHGFWKWPRTRGKNSGRGRGPRSCSEANLPQELLVLFVALGTLTSSRTISWTRTKISLDYSAVQSCLFSSTWPPAWVFSNLYS